MNAWSEGGPIQERPAWPEPRLAGSELGPRRASRHVKLVLSGALSAAFLGACSPSSSGPPSLRLEQAEDSQVYTNNAYSAGRGYYHSHSRVWYPYAWGHYDNTHGYFYDGRWTRTRAEAPATLASSPRGVARVSSTGGSHSGSGGVFRGGFGHSSHSVVS